ncbi:MAG: hypothetical protein HKN42_00090 [Granulosicoccus sp.]|nr:hypothetical protein [Granulosicoccus sp.]
MSLINDMLKDLEQRNNQTLSTSRNASQKTAYQHDNPDVPLNRCVRPVFFKVAAFTVFLTGFSLASSTLNAPAKYPDSVQTTTYETPMSEQSVLALNSILQTNINTTEQQFLDAVETIGSNSRLNDVNPPTANPSLEFSRHSTPAHNTADILSAQAPTQTLIATGGIPVPQTWATTADTNTQGNPDTEKSNAQETSESALSTQSQVTRPRIEIVNANYSPH